MGEEIKDLSISVAELYGAAAILDIQQLQQIPNPDALDTEAPLAKGWAEEEFDGTIRLLPDFTKMVELCASPEIYGDITIYKADQQAQYHAYVASDDALCLRVEDSGYIANICDVEALVEFIASEIPTGDASGEPITVSQIEAAEKIAQPEIVVRIAFADLTAVGDEDSAVGQNWTAVYDGSTLWQIEEGNVVTMRPLNRLALQASLLGIFAVKGGE